MADTKISALTAGAAVADADEFAANEGGNSRKKTALQLKTYMRTPTVPTIVSVGAEFSSTGTPTATLPGTHATDDILVLIIHTSNQSFTTPTNYNRAGPANGIGTSVTAGALKLFVFWKRDGGSESAPTLSDSGDHTYGVMLAVRGCNTIGDPFTLGGQAWKFATSTTGTGPASVAAGYQRLIMDIFAHHVDQAGANATGTPVNADLSNIVEQFDDSTTDGTGGGIVVVTGTKASPGAVGATTITWTTTSADVSTRLHFIPADDEPASVDRGPETQFFIGSADDLDDTWTKPSGARRIFAQIMDGGGGGSGGNITTTAAGGGGGGGGGYNEAWFDTKDLAATITVHAGKGGAAGTALNQAGNVGVVSEFDKGGSGPLTSLRRITGTAATAAASADGGNGGCGSGSGTVSPAVSTTRRALNAGNAACASSTGGAPGGSGTTAPVGGSEGDWGGGGGESGADTDAATTATNNGSSMRGAGGGSGGRTNTNISQPGNGGGVAATFAAQGAEGAASTRFPYGGAGGVGGGSSVVTGGSGGFPGGGGGGGAGVAGGFGGRGGHGMVVVTTFF